MPNSIRSAPALNPQNYYRMPWSLTDNGVSWLEVTSQCNLACEGCYHENIRNGHKSLVEIAAELEVFKKNRKSDCMSLAGGEPLVHPQITDIVRVVREGGWKPILNSNGLALTPDLLKALKKAGVFGFTFHIDTSQSRRDSHATVEPQHNALRLKLAEMVAKEGGMVCSFNQTVSSDSLQQIPEMIRWAEDYPDIINTMVFILFRAPSLSASYDFFVQGKKIDLYETYVKTSWGGNRNLNAADLVEKIREGDPSYEPAAYLNGTVDPNTMKWTIASRIANRKKGFGFVSPKFMETVQTFHHRFTGKWMSYGPAYLLKAGRSAMAAFSLFDPVMRLLFRRFLASPGSWFKRAYIQTFAIIQPVDILADGRMNMCDGCPDMTVHEGKLYWSCRLEEVKKFGTFVSAVAKADLAGEGTNRKATAKAGATYN
ncbi:MAG TPA: radical SAM protein [bacterium]|nr:radical SAM protein [bacterium]